MKSSIDTTEKLHQNNEQQIRSQQLTEKNEFSFWVGFAFDSYRLWGKMPDTKIRSAGIRYNRKLAYERNFILEYNLSASLYSKYSYPSSLEHNTRTSLSGFGISPLGFQVNFAGDKNIQPFLNTSAGLMLLNKRFPDIRGKKMNFTFGAGGGIEIFLSKSVSLSAGIKYHHLSNGDRGEINPGIDSNLYYTTITIF
jgi:opacity protein-like surface antigen